MPSTVQGIKRLGNPTNFVASPRDFKRQKAERLLSCDVGDASQTARRRLTAHLPRSRIEFVPRSYTEDAFDTSSGQVCRATTVRKHSLRITFVDPEACWHVRITFSAAWPASTKFLQRKKVVQSFCSQIRFDCIPLLRDTVTEIILSSEQNISTIRILPVTPHSSDPRDDIFTNRWYYYTREDTWRVRFPSATAVISPNTRIIDLSAVTRVEELAPGVHVAKLNNGSDSQLRVYKEIDRPGYEARDTALLVQELHNLERLRELKHIVQLAAAVVSHNPYRTRAATDRTHGAVDDELVFRGLLVDYHPNGTLSDALRRSSSCESHPSISFATQKPSQDTLAANGNDGGRIRWLQWAVHIARGLETLHSQGLAHMDLKPSNVVISQVGDAVIIDVNGASLTQDWLAPEMRDVFDPCSSSLEEKQQNDAWAFGKILSHMAAALSSTPEGMDSLDNDTDKLRAVAEALMRNDSRQRCSIATALSRLEAICL